MIRSKVDSHKPFFVIVAGARPNFMKVAPLIWEFRKRRINHMLVHTGQHYAPELSKEILRDLRIKADINLEVGSGTHARQTASVLVRMEELLKNRRPNAIIVVGDVNSTIASALSAAKLTIPVVHVEAGLRSFDRSMPEEINRILTDRISDVLLTPSSEASRQLAREGISKKDVFFVGNIMIDALFDMVRKTKTNEVLLKNGLQIRGYALVTLHRPSNVDSKPAMENIIKALREISKETTVLFPAHPRTIGMLRKHGLYRPLISVRGLRLMKPLAYRDFVPLMKNSKFVMTDSGGIQEEAVALKVPTITLRENTERPVTVKFGYNQIVGNDTKRIILAAKKAVSTRLKKIKLPPKWDGRTSARIADVLMKRFKS